MRSEAKTIACAVLIGLATAAAYARDRRSGLGGARRW